MHTVENQLGFICLTGAPEEDGLLTIKVNKIVAISNVGSSKGCYIITVEDSYWVKETGSEVIGQIQNVNPDLR